MGLIFPEKKVINFKYLFLLESELWRISERQKQVEGEKGGMRVKGVICSVPDTWLCKRGKVTERPFSLSYDTQLAKEIGFILVGFVSSNSLNSGLLS